MTTTLAQFRQNRLNVDLGLDLTSGTSGDGDNSFGTTAVRTAAIKVAFARLWPRMARLVVEDKAPSTTDPQYTLTTVRDPEAIELVGTTGIVLHDKATNWRFYYDETTPATPLRKLRVPPAIASGVNYLRVIGYVPYKSEFSGDSDTLDIPTEYEWVPAIAARAEIYRRQMNTRMNYERFNTLNRDNDVTLPELREVYLIAQREFEDAIAQHGRQFSSGRRATFNP